MMMMTPMWLTLLKVLVIFLALFTSIVYINIEIMKRQEAELKAAKAEADYKALFDCTMKSESGRSGCYHLQYEAKDYDGIIKELFKFTTDEGVVLFNTTTADSASFMPIPTQRGGTSQGLNRNQKHNQNQSPIPDPNRHYHQYHSLSQSDQDQYFKNVSAEVQSDQPQHLQRHPSDTTHRPPLTPPQPLNNTLSPCRNNSSDQLKTFCTEVDDYPNLSKFKAKLEQTYAKFFMTNIQPTDVSSRVGGDPADMYLCKSNSRVIFPKLGQKTDNTWELIVNDEEHKQGILIEECLGADKPCDFASNFPNHYQATCKQHYIQQTMVSIQGDDVGQAPFRFPSCCKCALKIV
ncbi:protein spaetzle isoform X2 [Drosophila subpulchrella]|uniref:protein spaetzle isoform X2 n=1 Tax=Drosophila subpulchrella TaxID=1486046 RepID=UPI0018A13243|nr:protein spaetzle isoform X2 [Drosophila subpulchrella]